MDNPPPAITIGCRNVAKQFGHVQALRDATVTVPAGKVVGLVGDNGAGKSTLLKILLGLQRPDAGEVIVDDRPVALHSIRDAQKLGVDAVHQDLALAPDLAVVDNMFLGHEDTGKGVARRVGILARRRMSSEAESALRALAIDLPSLSVPTRDLSGGQMQAVAVARAVMWARTAILMDEPTAALGARQSETVMEVARSVAAQGLGVLVVSHDLPRILAFCDTVSILWRGETVLEAPAEALTVPEMVAVMVGYRDEATA